MVFAISLVVSLAWGQLSTQFFYSAWLSILGIIYCLVGLFRRKRFAVRIVSILWSKLSKAIFYLLLLFLGFYSFYHRLPLGRTTPEALVYLISASVRMFFLLPKTSGYLDRIIKEVDDDLNVDDP